MHISRERFEELVSIALDEIPPEFLKALNNVVVLVEDHAPNPRLLGLYEGYALPHRGVEYSGVLPDRIFIYRDTIMSICESEDEIRREVTKTVVHEVAHHFGVSDERLHELGWG